MLVANGSKNHRRKHSKAALEYSGTNVWCVRNQAGLATCQLLHLEQITHFCYCALTCNVATRAAPFTVKSEYSAQQVLKKQGSHSDGSDDG